MSAIKAYFKQETKCCMFNLEHPKPADFYLTSWQRTKSVVPLLIWRSLLFLTSLGIVLSSMIIYILSGKFAYWFIYLTHWGLTSILLTTGFATAVSLRCYFYGPISVDIKLPWYVKTYWVLYNIAFPVALMITIFYWTLLYNTDVEEELNHGLDVAVHGINSVVMVLLLITSGHPSRLLHMYQPITFATVYMLFGLFYHLAGGTDPKGNPYIYPVVNWSEPSTTALIVFITGLLLVVLHFITMALAVGRDALSLRYRNGSETARANEGMPLRQPERIEA